MKIGDRLTAEQFRKFAPLGLEMTSQYGTKIYYDKSRANEEVEPHLLPGYMFKMLHWGTINIMAGVWNRIGDFEVSKLPNTPLLKRKAI